MPNRGALVVRGSGSGASLSLVVPAGILVPGSVVSGTFEAVLTQALTVRGARVRFTGRSHTHWSSGSGKHRHNHSGTEELLSAYFVCAGLGKGEGGPNMVLPVGQHSWPFSFMVPIGLPPSCAALRGGVTYAIEGYLDVPMWPDVTSQPVEVRLLSGQPVPAPVLACPLSAASSVPLSVPWCCGRSGVARLACEVDSRLVPQAQGVPLAVRAGASADAESLATLCAEVVVLRVCTYAASDGAVACDETVLASAPLVPGSLDAPLALAPFLFSIDASEVPSLASRFVSVHYALRVVARVPWQSAEAQLDTPLWVTSCAPDADVFIPEPPAAVPVAIEPCA